MGSPKLVYHRINSLDNIEWLDAESYQADFPTHFHDRICLTLVKQGLECTLVNNQRLLTPPGSLSLTPANKVHANPNINDEGYSFLTYYISPDVFRYFAGTNDFHFKEQVITNPNLYHQLLQFATEQKDQSSPDRLVCIMQQFYQQYVVKSSHRDNKSNSSTFNYQLVCEFIQEHLDQKITLEHLSARMGISRFSFLRTFKKSTGITPGQFITIKRVEAGKNLLRKGYPLVEAALSVGFFDQSHFHRHFKNVVGITPRAYQQACNIIQD